MSPILLLAPAPSAAMAPNAQPWHQRMEILIPVLLAAAVVLAYIISNLRHWASSLHTRHDRILDPIQLEELMVGMAPLVVDLRSREEFLDKRGHIRGAVNIPFPELPTRFEELRTTLGSRGIVLVEVGDVLSHQAYQFLHRKDFEWLYVLRGGMKAWWAEKYPTYQTEVPRTPKPRP